MTRQTVRIPDPLVGWQEIDEADYANEHGEIENIFRRGLAVKGAEHLTVQRSFRQYNHAGFFTACPISVPPGLEIRRFDVTKTCEGRRKVTPHRVCVQALLDVPGLRDWPGFVHLNGHLPYRAPDLWTEAHRSWKEIVKDWDRWSITTTRDTNFHGAMPKLDVFERPLLKPSGIDKITEVRGPAGRRLHLEVLDQKTVDLTVDKHNARGVLVRFTNPDTGDQLVLWIVTANIGRGVSQREARANIALVRRGFRVRERVPA